MPDTTNRAKKRIGGECANRNLLKRALPLCFTHLGKSETNSSVGRLKRIFIDRCDFGHPK